MAIIRTGPIVGGISGALGSVVFVNTSTGPIVRPRPTRVRVTSPSLQLERARLTIMQKAWGDLSALQQAAWNTYARDFPSLNRLGISKTNTGFVTFVQFNLLLLNTSQTISTDPPINGRAPTPDTITIAFSVSGTYTLTALASRPPALGVIVASGYPFAATNRTRTPPRVRFLRSSSIFLIGLDIKSEWIALFGDLIEGQQVAVSVYAKVSDHFPSTPTIARGVAVA